MRPATWGVLAGLVLVLGAGGFARWIWSGSGAGRQVVPVSSVAPPMEQSPVAPAAGGLYFPNTTVDVAVATDASTVTVEFPFENRSGARVEIATVERNCSCAEIAISDNGKLIYEPGEGGIIRARYELGNFTGLVEKPFGLYLKGDPQDRPSHRLTPRITIAPLLELTEKTLKWEIDGQATTKRTEVRVVGDKPVRVLAASSSLESMRVDLKELEAGRRYEIRVTPEGTSRPALALIRIETDSVIPRWKAQQVFALIQAPNRVMPQRL